MAKLTKFGSVCPWRNLANAYGLDYGTVLRFGDQLIHGRPIHLTPTGKADLQALFDLGDVGRRNFIDAAQEVADWFIDTAAGR
jgi:hypothetical protein